MINYIIKILNKEIERQNSSINLIASENYFDYIINFDDSILIGKYAEGYPKKRYYAGCKYIDVIEKKAIDSCKKLFNVKYANVQPHSGSQANQAVYMALCNVGDKILGLNLQHGGHLTHGSNFNFSGYVYKSLYYGLNINGYIDYDHIDTLVELHRPKLIIAGASAYSRMINWNVLKKIAIRYNAFLLADISHIAGAVAAKIYPTPNYKAHVVTFTLHKTLRGPRGAAILSFNKKINLLINKGVFPGIQGGPFINVILNKYICFKKSMLLSFKKYQKNILLNAKKLAFFLNKRGFEIISNGTDSHLFLINLVSLNLTGVEAEKILEKANIILNKNTIPNDLFSANKCSGIRLGTAAITTRGLNVNSMYILSEWIYLLLIKKKNPYKIKKDIVVFCKKFKLHDKKNKKAIKN